MTTKQVLEIVAAMPTEEWMKIQSGIAEMVAARFSAEETSEIREALADAETEFARGEGIGSKEMRRRFGLQCQLETNKIPKDFDEALDDFEQQRFVSMKTALHRVPPAK